ncbi:MAG: LPS export ABC transporter periplasmic protein LptC [Candidatus Bipolaricaulota bacterium]|nr:LPS export ABC transporter periplasmic protein LptC [Candidatus Bipolaricaulota bacterium]
MSRASQALGLLVIGGLIGGLYWLWATMPSLWSDEGELRAPAISAESARIVRYDDHGKKLWELKGRSLTVQEDVSVGEEVTLRFFDSEGGEVLVVWAPQARLHNRTGDIELLGEISAVGREFSFVTRDLIWDNSKKLLKTESSVRIEREEFVLTGEGLEYLAETGRATILRDARLILRKP